MHFDRLSDRLFPDCVSEGDSDCDGDQDIDSRFATRHSLLITHHLFYDAAVLNDYFYIVIVFEHMNIN